MCGVLIYTEQLLILVSTVTRCVPIPAFASLVGIPVGITSSAVGLNICLVTARIKKYKSIIKKKKKKHDKLILLAKNKLIDSNITHDEFVSLNNVQKECGDMKEEIKNFNKYV